MLLQIAKKELIIINSFAYILICDKIQLYIYVHTYMRSFLHLEIKSLTLRYVVVAAAYISLITN